MSGVTEIYICKRGQTLKQGKLVYGHHITNKDEAESDAAVRCNLDPGIWRIAYYSVDEKGEFRNIFTYENPRMGNSQPKPKATAGSARSGKRRATASRTPTLLARVRKVFEED